jgi:hypothetical protein
MTITSRDDLNQSKLIVFIIEIDLASSCFFRSSLQVSNDMTSIEARQVEKSAQDLSGKIIAPWTFDVKFPLDTQFTFRSLTFVVEGDEDLMMLPPRSAPERLVSTDGQAPWPLMISSISGGA